MRENGNVDWIILHILLFDTGKFKILADGF